MAVSIEYKNSVAGDLKRLDSRRRLRIVDRLERALRKGAPGAEALKGEFAGMLRLRFGDYRAIFARTAAGYLVLRIAHRREVYR